jgi:hypothetical protein
VDLTKGAGPDSVITEVGTRGVAAPELSPINHVSGRSLGEESDGYPVIAKLNDRWRVVTCGAGIQWILQRRRGDRWSGYWFCRTREALIRGAREYAGEINGAALVTLLRLPERTDGAWIDWPPCPDGAA